MFYDINIFGQNACAVPFRISPEGRIPGKFYYGIKHSGIDYEPSTVEVDVIVNFLGTLVTPEALDFGGIGYIKLNDAQKSLISEIL